jgi:hypothetical protein
MVGGELLLFESAGVHLPAFLLIAEDGCRCLEGT